jgi:amino acid adenylation domain-containing protein
MSLHQLLIDSAARDPDGLAVAGPAGEMRYGELDRLADTLAHALAERGVRPGDRVVVWAEKSPQVVAALQAVLRIGAVYVPLAGNTPVGRAALLARDCAARAVCTTAGLLDGIAAALGPGTACLDLTGYDAAEVTPINSTVVPGDLAYILYTSGSTGTPKGVCISHRNARSFVDWAVEELGAHAGDRFGNHAQFSFDLSVLDLYAAFSVGAAVVLFPGDLGYDPVRLTELLHAERITIWYSVPSALMLMLGGSLLTHPAPPMLRTVIFAGEPFPIAPLRHLAGWTDARLLNFYGPTETNVCTFHEVQPEDLRRDRPVPIGRACCGDEVRAVAADGTPAAPGEQGELVVDGPTVMDGYWGSPPHAGPYATGDVVRVLSDGSFDYLGRTDDMVKVRGYRVELGEVEAVLCTHLGVAEVAAAATGTGLHSRLVAFVVPASDDRPGLLGLKRHLAQRLPPYMVVDDVRFLDALPRSHNGKVDRARLMSLLSRVDD